MSKVTLLFSLILVLFLHFTVITFSYEKEKPIELKPKYNKISVQLSQFRKIPEEKIIKTLTLDKKLKKIIRKKPKIEKKIFKKRKKKIINKEIQEKIEKKAIKKETNILPSKLSTQFLEKTNYIKDNYLLNLRKSIDKNKKYPATSKRLNEEGTSIVSFNVLKSGLFQNIKLTKSSGKRRLDKAAINAVSKTYKFKPFTKEIEEDFLDITIPMRFRLIN